MKDSTRWLTSLMAVLVWAGTYYALVLYPYNLDADVKLWLTNASGAALLYMFGEAISNRTARQSAAASDLGAKQALSTSPPTPEGSNGSGNGSTAGEAHP